MNFLNDQYMDSSLFLVVFITGLTLVCAGLGMAILLSPKSFNEQKGQAYECGVPTKGTSWMQFRVGYYLYAILYLMFDVEAIFLFPWATVVRSFGIAGLYSILFFLFILGLGLAYAWKKGVLQWK
ncbi:NADH-quinone oxidoreductase subunit A [Dysgonomonas capnocytophagoides]|nr:NADH-quinone oxidoreductase subunit A [Dysgonomonas capnocytophagoides]